MINFTEYSGNGCTFFFFFLGFKAAVKLAFSTQIGFKNTSEISFKVIF